MRPLELSVAGLHSYREPVTIDFQELGRFGLFGIFGRIGSGKSTLLDGITLALYGLIDRTATRSRRGLVHPSADRCEVRFRFAVDGRGGGGAPQEVYEVHRSYREVDGVAQRVASRLIKLGADGSRGVLTDKEGDTTSAVSEIVGLGPEDFMRAVVLPQGRFLHLLHLKGTERRQMLQRIFKLQAYGEGLRRQVRARLETTRAEVAAVRGELLGLGDASPEAVEEARAAKAASAAEAKASDLALEEARGAHDAAVRVRERLAQRRGAEAALRSHDAGLQAHDARRTRLEQAERLRPLVGPAGRWRDAVGRRGIAEAAAAEAAGRATLAEQAAAEVQTRLGAARGTRASREPTLRERIARFEQVVRWEAELHQEEARGTEVQAGERVAAAALASAEGAEAEARAKRAALEVARRQAKRELGRCRVTAEQREAVARALRASERVAAAQRQAEEAGAALREATSEVERTRAALEAAENELASRQRAAAQARARAQEAEGAHDRLGDEDRERLRRELAARDQAMELIASRREAAAEAARAATARRVAAEAEVEVTRAARHAAAEVLRGAERAIREAERALEVATSRASAAELARQLRADLPCPVCGSPHHPSPAATVAEPLPIQAVEAHRMGRDRAVVRHEAAVEADARAGAELDAARADERAAADQQAKAAEAARVEGDPERRAEVLAALETADRADQRWRAALDADRAAQAAVERSALPHAAARAALAAASEAQERARAVREARSGACDQAWSAFDRDRGQFTLFDVNAAAVALESRDRQAEALDTRIDQFDAEIAVARQVEDTERAESERHRTELARLRERLGEVSSRVADLNARIALAGQGVEGPAAVELEIARAELSRVLTAVPALEAEAAEVSEVCQRAVRARDGAEAELRATVSEEAAADRALIEVAAAAAPAWAEPGADRAAAVGALLADPPSDGAIAALKREVGEWEAQRVQLQARVDTLAEQEPAVSDEAWAAIAHRFSRCAERAEAAREAAIGAARQFEALEARAPRHASLVTGSKALDLELGRLDELSSLLRGDRFVEFVANDHLADLTARATLHLLDLTHGRYRLQLDDELAFVVQDEDAGGALRPVHSLSGGESFLTALALALALSAQVQQRSERPLGFFFLDEGFGTLDAEALDRVMTAIEGLRSEHRLIGLISHVPAVRERVPRYLWVHPASGGAGSSVELREN